MSFDAKKVKDDIVKWIQDFFEVNGKDCNAVVAISGGKDSSIVAALCVEALGKDRVVGVLLPKGVQKDIDMSEALVEHLGIRNYTVNIESCFDGLIDEMKEVLPEISTQTITNLPPRLRMAATYAVSQSVNGRVANTSNLSEDWVGYCTRYGDSAGDFSPLCKLTVQEVKAVGRELGLPEKFIEKTPIDGLQPKTDEDNLGFTYATLDKYIREGICEDPETKAKIDRMHEMNKFKIELMPYFDYKEEE